MVVSTSASKVVAHGPGLEKLDDDLNSYTESAVFSGVVDGTIATADNLTFTFTPDSPLEPDRLYKVLLSTKIVTKTINAVVADGGNTSTGSFETKGPYTGNIADTYTITVDDAGTLGTATFHFTPTSTGLESETLTTDRSVELEKGIFLEFKSGNFVAGDSWTFTVVEGEALDELYQFSFTTGSSPHGS